MMVACEQCQQPMIREDWYNPGEDKIIKVATKHEDHWWVCINRACPIGRANTQEEVAAR